MPAQSLYDYYASQGKPLPPLAERGPVYESFGLGPASTYTGSTTQNSQLLQRLIAGGSPSAGAGTAQPPNAPPPGPNYSDIAKNAGASDLGFSDYTSLFGATPEEQQAARDAIAKKFGYDNSDAFLADVFQKPSQTTTDFYNSAYGAAGLDKILGEITNKRNDLQRATGVIGDNPWLDEASRTGRVGRLNEMANADIANLANEYNLRLGKVHDLVTQHAADIGETDALRTARLAYLEKAAQEAATSAAMNRARTYFTDYSAGKASLQKPDTVSIGENSTLYKWNPLTKSFEFVARGPGSGSGDSPYGVTTVGGDGIVAGHKVDPDIAGDVEDVLSGRNTLYNIRQTMGRTNAAAKYMARMRAAIRSIDPKFDFVASDAGGKFASSEFYNRAISAITSVEPNIDKAVSLSDQVNRIGIRGVDELLQKGAVQIGSKKVANFREAQKLIADEIGLALGQGTVSDMKLQLGLDVTDPAVSPEVFASNMALVKEFIQNRKKALQDQRYSSGALNADPANTEDIDQTIRIHQNDYPTREQLIDAIVGASGLSRDLVASRVYSVIPDKR